MIFGSLCSGIEAASVAWKPLGWRAAFVSEIDKFPSAVLSRRHPETPNLGDMTRFKDWSDYAIDILVGGTPCQSFSVAGLRKGLADPRGNLMLTYLAIAARYRPRWVVWENVPGVLSSNEGRDFGTFLGGLAELGYGFAYRILDAQYVRVESHSRAVPQRRRRVFVVGCLGDWRRAAAVLFERESLRGDSPPSRNARQGVAPTLASRTRGGGGLGTDFDLNGGLVESPIIRDVAGCLNSAGGHAVPGNSIQDIGFDASEDGTGRGTPLVAIPHTDTMPTMMNGANTPAGHNARSGHSKDSYIVPVTTLAIRGRDGSHQLETREDGTANAILTPNGGRGGIGCGAIQTGWAVRRLTPLECERLQGFPDGYTDIRVNGKPTPDGPRYKALGNSMAINAMSWIGERIQSVESI